MLYEFKHTKNHFDQDFEGIEFCIRALSKNKDEMRIQCMHLHVARNIMTGTDGSRIHVYDLRDKFPKGWYRVIKKTRGYIALYRDPKIKEIRLTYSHLFPKPQKPYDPQDPKNPKNPEPVRTISIETEHNLTEAVYKINTETNTALNIDFVKDLKGYYEMTIPEPDDPEEGLTGNQPLYFKANRKQAVIMPCMK